MVIVYKGVKHQLRVKLQKKVSNFICLLSLISSDKNIDIKLTDYNDINGKNKYFWGKLRQIP